jgi:hypothetical protein
MAMRSMGSHEISALSIFRPKSPKNLHSITIIGPNNKNTSSMIKKKNIYPHHFTYIYKDNGIT